MARLKQSPCKLLPGKKGAVHGSGAGRLMLANLFATVVVVVTFAPLKCVPLMIVGTAVVRVPMVLNSLFYKPGGKTFLKFMFKFADYLGTAVIKKALSSFMFSPILTTSLIKASNVFGDLFVTFIPEVLMNIVPCFMCVNVGGILTSRGGGL